MKTGLRQLELARVEASEKTPEDRIAELKLLLDKLGPEAQAEAIKALTPALLKMLV